MKLRGLSTAACAVAMSLCSHATPQLTVGEYSGPDLQQVGRDDVSHDRCIRIEFEDNYGIPVQTEVTFSKRTGDVGVAPATGPCVLRDVSDLLTLRFKNPLTQKMQQLDLDLRGQGSLDLLICIDDAGQAKVIRMRQAGGALVRQSGRGDVPGFVLNGLFGVSNDDCVDAMDIGSAGSFDYFYAPFLTTTDGPEACNWFGETQIDNDTWFRWTAPCTGIVFATNCDAALGDSKVAVYDGAMCPTEGSAPLACNDDFCGPFFLDSAVFFEAIEGEEYLFRVGKSPATKLIAGGGTFTITCVAAPENDFCEDAVLVTPGSSTFGTTFAGTVDTNVPESCPGPFFDVPVDSPGVWYEVIGTGGEMRANICNSELNFLSRLTVYCAEGGCEDLTCVGAVRNQICLEVLPLGIDPAVNWCSTEGAVYKILVHGALGFAGNFRLDVDDLGDCLSEPVPCFDVEKFGACCDGNNCIQTTEGECLLAGGTFLGDGVDCCGTGLYDAMTLAGVPSSISPGATSLFGAFADDEEVEVPLGFCFDYFGETYDRVTVTTNGLLVFGDDGVGAGNLFQNSDIPSGLTPDNFIAALWDDWVVDTNSYPNSGVQVETIGEPGSRTFIVEWTGLAEFGVPNPGPASFQTRLSEETGGILTSFFAFPIPEGAGDRTVGIENGAGTEGYQIDEMDVLVFDRASFQPTQTPPCGEGKLVLVAGGTTLFSDLDGGPLDRDGIVDGVFTREELVLSGAEIVVDVPHATFDISGRLTMTGQGRIDGQTAFMQPDVGPTICILACRGVAMRDNSRITSRGSEQGGDILVCSDQGSVVLDDRAAINASAYSLSALNTRGGSIQVVAKKRVALNHYLTHVTASGQDGGEVSVSACGGFDRAIELFGRLQAVGYAATGQGGSVFVEARKGGAFVSTGQTLKTEGGPFGQNGFSAVVVATMVTAPGLGETVVSEGHVSSVPCSCAVADTIDPGPEGGE